MQSRNDPEESLLGENPLDAPQSSSRHAFTTAPIITGDALEALEYSGGVLPQRALYGRNIAQHVVGFPMRPTSSKIYINTNAPFSAVVCGVQGSGKSHTTSVLLESCLIRDERLGTLPQPLSGLVFHFDTAAGGGLVQPCEAAYIASLDASRGGNARAPPVKVLVLPSNLVAMKKVYAGLPGVTVEALRFGPRDISGDRLLAMMKVEEGNQIPLYMECIMSILRSMEGEFDYADFRAQLSRQEFSGTQKAMLNLRLSLLDSCLQGGNDTNKVSNHFLQGQLTIIDLSSPFMDGSSACGFFDMILGLFIEADAGAGGKLVVLDEAHKYISETGSSSRLTESLLTVIRQQRHLATRVIISTQEPTVVPTKFLDLCSFIIAHRFSSPKWLKRLAEHVSTAGSMTDELFEKIVALRTGEAILFSPSGIGLREGEGGQISPFGQGYLHVRSRLRITRDGGHSVLAVQDAGSTTRIERVRVREDIVLPPTPPPSSPLAPTSVSPSPARISVVQKVAVPVSKLLTVSLTSASSSSKQPGKKTYVSNGEDFSPLIEYLRAVAKATPAAVPTYKTVRKRLRENVKVPNAAKKTTESLDQYISRASHNGYITIVDKGGNKSVKLSPGV